MKEKYKNIVILLLAIVMLSGCGSKSAGDYNKEGQKFFEEATYEKAEESFKKAVTANPEKAEYYIDYGFSLIKTKKYDAAQIQFDKAMIKKDNQIVRENNKRAHRGKGIAYFESADFSKATEEFTEALNIKELDSTDRDLLYYKGSAEAKNGQYEEALTTYETILKKDKPDAKLYGILAETTYKLGNTAEALDYYDKAINLEDNGYEYYFGKYAILTAEKNTEEAKKILTQALAIKTKTDRDYYYLAVLHYFSGETASAKTELNKASEKGFSEAEFYLGEIAYQEADYQTSVLHYETYLEKNTEIAMVTVYNQLSSALTQTGEYKKALEYIQKGVALGDAASLPILKHNEIALFEKTGDFEEAYKKAKEYVKQYPDAKDMEREAKFLKTRINTADSDKTK